MTKVFRKPDEDIWGDLKMGAARKTNIQSLKREQAGEALCLLSLKWSFLEFRWLLRVGLFLISLFALSACQELSQFGLKTGQSNSAAERFGVTGLTLSKEGRFVLTWELPEEMAGPDEGGFEIFLASWKSLPSSFKGQEQRQITAPSEGSVAIGGVSMGEVDDGDTPRAQRALLSTVTGVRGVRSHVVTVDLLASPIYAFQVVYQAGDPPVDANRRVLIYEPRKNSASFAGVSSLIKTASGKTVLTWSSPLGLKTGDEANTAYQIYLESSRESLQDVVNRGRSLATSSLPGSGELSLGQLVDYDADSDVLRRGSLLAEVKGVTQAEISTGLIDGLTHIVRVVAKTPSGGISVGARALVYRPDSFVFAGLKDDGVVVAPDLSTIDVSWTPAEGAGGEILYSVYGNGNLVGSTKGTRFQIPNPLPGRTYTLYVVAQDRQTSQGASSIVTKVVPIPTTYEGCLAATTVSSSSVRVSFVYPRGADQVAVLRDGTLVFSATSDLNTAYVDTGRTPDTNYTYTCRVKYGSQTVEGSRSLAARTAGVLSFGGLLESGVVWDAVNQQLNLSWAPATNGSGVVTYRIYRDAPAFSNSGIVATTTSTTLTITSSIMDLSPGTELRLGVRAVDQSGTVDTNTAVVVRRLPKATGLAPIAPASLNNIYTDGDRTARIMLKLADLTASGTKAFKIYVSNSPDIATFDLTRPWEEDSYTVYPPQTAGGYPYIYVGGRGRTFSGPNYFLVRDGSTNATDSNQTVSNLVPITANESNYVYVAPAVSGLSYGYYIGISESTLSGPAFVDGDGVTDDEARLLTCSHAFHTQGQGWHSQCGTRNSVAKATHATRAGRQGATPSVLNWHQAFVSCRNASEGSVLVRLPTDVEWQRASRWDPSGYATMWDTYADISLSGLASIRQSMVGAYDMAGGVREWVDARLRSYTLSSEETVGGGPSPTVGRFIANGIHQQRDSLANSSMGRLYHIQPDTYHLALLMGSDQTPHDPTDAPKSYDVETESWQDPRAASAQGTAYRGFRCVAFPNVKVTPTMEQLALPSEPTYQSADRGTPGTIPPGRHVGDSYLETVTLDTNAQSVTLRWRPWSKTVCNPNCGASSIHSYEVYRYIEPSHLDLRPRHAWAVKHGSYASLPSLFSGGPTGMPLDPLVRVGESGEHPCTQSNSVCKLVATVLGSQCHSSNVGACMVTETHGALGFNWGHLYRYVVVVRDQAGNREVPRVQVYRPEHLAGPPSLGATRPFRREIRWRRIGPRLLGDPLQELTYVPMHTSGYDQDYWIQTFASSVASGSVGSEAYPPQPTRCRDQWARLGTLSADECGTATVPSVQLLSQATGVGVEMSQGAAFFACLATTLTAGPGSYSLFLPSEAQWLAATTADPAAMFDGQWTANQVDAAGANSKGRDQGVDSWWFDGTYTNDTGVVTGRRASARTKSITDTNTGATHYVRCAL